MLDFCTSSKPKQTRETDYKLQVSRPQVRPPSEVERRLAALPARRLETATAVYWALVATTQADRHGLTFCSRESLGAKIDRSAATISRTLELLELAGLVVRLQAPVYLSPGQCRPRYFVAVLAEQVVAQGGARMVGATVAVQCILAGRPDLLPDLGLELAAERLGSGMRRKLPFAWLQLRKSPRANAAERARRVGEPNLAALVDQGIFRGRWEAEETKKPRIEAGSELVVREVEPGVAHASPYIQGGAPRARRAAPYLRIEPATAGEVSPKGLFPRERGEDPKTEALAVKAELEARGYSLSAEGDLLTARPPAGQTLAQAKAARGLLIPVKPALLALLKKPAPALAGSKQERSSKATPAAAGTPPKFTPKRGSYGLLRIAAQHGINITKRIAIASHLETVQAQGFNAKAWMLRACQTAKTKTNAAGWIVDQAERGVCNPNLLVSDDELRRIQNRASVLG